MNLNSSSYYPSLFQKAWGWFASSIVNKPSFSGYFEPLVQWLIPQWRNDRIRSKVMTVRHESSDMYTLVIKPSSAFKIFLAGQYIELTVMKEGAWMSRFFSISSSPEYFQQSGLIEISIRIQDKGLITPWLLTALKKGSVVNLIQAQGEFVLPSQAAPMLMIAGGSGITPLRSMLQELSLEKEESASDKKGVYPERDVTLMFYARSSEHFLFEKELQNMHDTHHWLNVVFIDSDKSGFFKEEHLLQSCPDALNRQVYICGPAPMITAVRNELKQAQFKDARVHYEFFGPEPMANAAVGSANVLFQASNKQVSVEDGNEKSLLTLAQEQNTNPVFGCGMGVCHQCICQKKSGVVYNQKTQQYSDTGHQDIQLCISVPVGDVVLDL